jgi:sugar lactone lactonase YvrE
VNVDGVEAHRISDSVNELGESPAWDAESGRVLWVDIARGDVLEGSLSDGRVSELSRFHAGDTVGAVMVGQSGERIVAAARHLLRVGRDGTPLSASRVIGDRWAGRLNDAKVDPWGRVLVGTASFRQAPTTEALFREEIDGSFTVIDDSLTLSNGIGWSPDGQTLYYVDSLIGQVWARDYRVSRLGPRRAHLRLESGIPDGICVDDEGQLWIAVWGEGHVLRFRDDGRPTARVSIDCSYPTSVAFVGSRLDTLLITTAGDGLFAADVGVAGWPTAPALRAEPAGPSS